MKKSSSKAKKAKKVFNFLWIAGTCIAVILVVFAICVNIYVSHKENVKASVLANLSKYNAKKFGYIAGGQESIKYRNISASIPEDLQKYLDTVNARNAKILKSYNLVSVLIDEPVDDIKIIEDEITEYADFWHIVKEGINYYGTPNDGTLSEYDVPLVEFNSPDVDTFIESLDSTIRNNNELVVFIDYDYAQVPLFGTLCEELSNVINNAEKADKLVVEFTVISELGSPTSNLDYLYDLVHQLK